MKLYIGPSPKKYAEDGRGSGGIWRVICAQARWLPLYDIEIVDSPETADVVNTHAGEIVDTDKPLVVSNHGLYWTGDSMQWGDDFWLYNNQVIEALRRAHRIVVPSEWVARPILRDMRRQPIVIPHGIDGDLFRLPSSFDDYVLWAKPRVDVVSDPTPVNELAQRATDVPFRTTFGRPTQNVAVIGTQTHKKFCQTLSLAAVYLATARETGDIASREAMAYGVPVLGWNWGGTGELVRHRETGYLARVGDYDDLVEGLRYCLAHRRELGMAARDDVLRRFQWRDIMGLYAAVYRDVLAADTYSVDVSVVVPTFNYARFLPACLDSVLSQQYAGTVEIVVVDDASTDETTAVLEQYGSRIPLGTDRSLRVVRHAENRGLPAALNTGHAAAQGRFLLNLDADNVLEPGALQTLVDAMLARPWVDVGVGYYRIMNTDRVHGGPVDVQRQLGHDNQVPSTCIMRTRSIKPYGGYRTRQRKNEDAEWWCRTMSAGLRVENVTNHVIFQYRWHGQNKSALEGGEDDREGPLSWNFYFPWRINTEITPFAQVGHPTKGSWPVRSYDRPHIAVIIPCGPGHEKLLMDALDSVAGQTFPYIECIVANDTGAPLNVAALGHPWVKVVECGAHNAAVARNTAINEARAPLIVPLDADDMLYPGILARYYAAWLREPDNLVYADCDIEDAFGQPRRTYQCGPWSWEHIRREAIFQDTIMFPKRWWRAVGGYPVGQYQEMWEDWLFGVMLGVLGKGATYLEGVQWGVYRQWTSGASGQSKNDHDSAGYNTPEYRDKYTRLLAWIDERIPMCRSCGKGKSAVASRAAKAVIDIAAQGMGATAEGNILVVYTGAQAGSFSVNSVDVAGRKYRVTQNEPFEVPVNDWLQRFSRLKGFERVKPPEAAVQEQPSLPSVPPEVAPVETLPVPAPAVATSSAPLASETVTPSPSRFGVGSSLDSLGLPDGITSKLRSAGFTMDSLRADLAQGGVAVRNVKGVGRATLQRIQEALGG